MDTQNYSCHKNEIIDTLDAIEVLRLLAKGRKIIIISVFIFLLFGLVMVIFKTPVYKAEVIISEPLQSQIIELEIDDLYELTSTEVFWSIKNALKNNKYIFDFYINNKEFFKNYKIDKKDNIESELMKLVRDWGLVIIDEDDNIRQLVHFYIEYPEKVEGYNLINKYIDFVENKERELFVREFNKIKNSEIKEIINKIESNKVAYGFSKKSNMEVLNEAILVARKIGIEEPYSSVDKFDPNSNTILKAEINNTDTPLYYRGYKALEAEKLVLQNRKNEKIFFPEIVELESKMSYLKNKKIDMNSVQVINWIQEAYKSNEEIKPSKAVWVLLFIGIGFFVGIFSVFVRFLLVRNVVSKSL